MTRKAMCLTNHILDKTATNQSNCRYCLYWALPVLTVCLNCFKSKKYVTSLLNGYNRRFLCILTEICGLELELCQLRIKGLIMVDLEKHLMNADDSTYLDSKSKVVVELILTDP